MKKYLYIGAAIIVGIVLYDLFLGWGMSAKVFPVSGGSLCGPICPPTGPSHWEKTCRGVEVSEHLIDASRRHCIGFVSGDKRCYGRWGDDDKGAPIEEVISCLSNATNLSYVEPTFGISFQYPEGYIETKKQIIWPSKEAYGAWTIADSASGLGHGGATNTFVTLHSENTQTSITVSVGTLNDYNSAGDGVAYYPETDRSFMVDGVKVYKAKTSSNDLYWQDINRNDFYWQNSHKPSLDTLWNAISVNGTSASEVRQVASLIQNTLSIE